jgi:hypothetical protein
MNDTMWPPYGRTARLSMDLEYRYELTRRWGRGPYVCFIMLNPSTADAQLDDPTIKRCMGFARKWRMGGLVVVNLFALRATDPKELLAVDNPVGPDNDDAIHDACVRARAIVCAWGGAAFIEPRAGFVVEMLRGRTLYCVGKTKAGAPRHPLYVAADATPVRYL